VRCLAVGDTLALALALSEGRRYEEEGCGNGAGEMHLVGAEDTGTFLLTGKDRASAEGENLKRKLQVYKLVGIQGAEHGFEAWFL
jgi:hypothetical protein